MGNKPVNEVGLEFKKEFSMKLKHFIENKLEMTHKAFAELFNMDRSQMSRLLKYNDDTEEEKAETNKKTKNKKDSKVKKKTLEYPTFHFLVRLKQLFPDIDLDYLLSSVKEPKKKTKPIKVDPQKTVINDWISDLEEGEIRYLSEEKSATKYLNNYLNKMEEKSESGRIYISYIFPSGLHRIEKDKDEIEKNRNAVFKNKETNKRNHEFYTVASFLQFCFGTFGERVYRKSDKTRMLLGMTNYFYPDGQRDSYKQLWLMDTSKAFSEDNFYGFPITRLVQSDHIISSETNRFIRVERNIERYKQLEKIFYHDTNSNILIQPEDVLIYLETARNSLLNTKENSPIETFLKNIPKHLRKPIENNYLKG